MDIGFVYSSKDPRQTAARDFLRRFVDERGVLARIIETEKEVTSPTVIINGHTLEDRRERPRGDRPVMYPAIEDIAEVLECQLWRL